MSDAARRPLWTQLAPRWSTVELLVAWATGQSAAGPHDLTLLCRGDPPVLLAWLWDQSDKDVLAPLPTSAPHQARELQEWRGCESLAQQSRRLLLRWYLWQPRVELNESTSPVSDCLQLWHRAGAIARRLAQALHVPANQAEVAARLACLGHLLHACRLLPKRALLHYHQQLAQESGWPRWLAQILADLATPLPADGAIPFQERLLRIVQCAWHFAQQTLLSSLRLYYLDWHELLNMLGVEADLLAEVQDEFHQPAPLSCPPSPWPIIYQLVETALQAQRQAQLAQLQSQRWQRLARTSSDQLQSALRERLLQALAHFAAGAAHEFGSPLAVISGYAEQLLRDEKRLDHIEALQRILAQCRRLDRLVQDLMFYARPPRPRWSRCRLDKLVTAVIGQLMPYAGEKRVTLQCQSKVPRATVCGDKTMLATALEHLVRNAIEAAPSGGWTRVSISQDDCQSVSVRVEDNGPGPEPAWQDYIFDPFFSGREARRGRGLGLCTVWRITQLHGGNIHWHRTPQSTTVFTLRLPCRAEASHGKQTARFNRDELDT
ncbi:MAG: HAMP domain-containing sensor histidine kinase [Gemmatales bacterium]|nr:HAMP domain-containing histidine kinase [Gemmatales bacterium]MDW7994231.1 HAMP domain-containing sensor histidine kinase [Gemmatales bacterium]